MTNLFIKILPLKRDDKMEKAQYKERPQDKIKK